MIAAHAGLGDVLRDVGSTARQAAVQAVRRSGWNLPVAVSAGIGKGLRIGLRNASADYHSGVNELPVQLALRHLLQEGDVFYDIGSNIGFFSLVAARLVGAGRVYAFEPVIWNASCIRTNADLNRLDNICVICAAVGRETGTTDLLLTRHPGGATIARDEQPSDVLCHTPVPVVAIDDLVASERIQPPSVVKIDVEGAELDVLRGMQATMAAHGPAIVCELDDARTEGLQAKLRSLRSWLGTTHYDLVVLPDAYPASGWHVLHVLAAPK